MSSQEKVRCGNVFQRLRPFHKTLSDGVYRAVVSYDNRTFRRMYGTLCSVYPRKFRLNA